MARVVFSPSSFCGGLGAAALLYVVQHLFSRWLFGRGSLRGRPAKLAPPAARFVDLSWGRVMYLWTRADPLPDTNSTAASADKETPLVVLVHGYGGNSDLFSNPTRSQYAKLLGAAGFDVLTYDHYAHGFSHGPDSPYACELFVAQLAELLTSLGEHRRFHLLGFSMGGAVATMFAARFPRRVRSLLLQAPAVCKAPLPCVLRALLRVPLLAHVVMWKLARLFGEGTNLDNRAVPRACYRLALTVASSGGWAQDGAHSHTQDLLGALRPDLPITVLWGEADRVVPFKNYPRVLESLQKSPAGPRAEGLVQAHAIAGADHMTFSEGPVEVREAFRQRMLHAVLSAEGRAPSVGGDLHAVPLDSEGVKLLA